MAEGGRTPAVSVAHLRALGLTWPKTDIEIAKACVREDASGHIDLDATIASLESSRAYVTRQIEEIHAFARRWGAPVDDVSDKREELGERRVALGEAIAKLQKLRDAVNAHVARAPLPDVDECEPVDPMAALRRAVLARPDDMDARFAYARALLGDDPHAQLIEAQCGALGLPAWSARRKVYEMRALAIAYHHAKELTHRVAAFCEAAYLHRGFVEMLRVEPDAFVRDAEKVFALEPIRALSIYDYSAGLAESTVLEPIRELRCTRVRMDALVASPHVGRLEELWVDDSDTTSQDEEKWFAIAACSGALRSLERLLLWNASGTPKGVRELARATGLLALRSLSVYGRSPGAESMAVLAQSPLARQLRSLKLTFYGEDEVRAFAPAPFSSLEELVIDGQYGRAPFGPLATLHAPGLRKLDVGSFRDNHDMVRMLASRDFEDLREVKLYLPEIDADALAALAEAPWLPRLEAFELNLHAAKNIHAKDLVPLLRRLGPSLRSLALTLHDGSGLCTALSHSPAIEHIASLGVVLGLVPKELGVVLPAAKKLEMIAIRPGDTDAKAPTALLDASFRPIKNCRGTFVREL
jgi:hypothetical protein